MADVEGSGDRERGVTSITDGDLQDMLRGGRATAGDSEPSVSFEEETPAEGGGGDSPERSVETPPQITAEQSRTLETISRLEREVENLRTRSVVAPSAASEPSVEFVDIVPGLRVPKDPTQWPVQLTPEMVQAVGINPGADGNVAKGLNVLANAFYYHIVNSFGPALLGQVDTQNRERERGQAHTRAFYSAYDDLQGAPDIVANTEYQLRQSGLHLRGLTDAQYAAEVATRSRIRLAALRGQNLEQYMGSMNAQRQVRTAPTQTTSRARFASSGSSTREARRQNVPASQVELNDLIDNTRRR